MLDVKSQIPLLGLKDCIKLDVISNINSIYIPFSTKEDVMREYDDGFKGLGKFPYEYHMQLNDNAIPVVMPVK